MSMNQMDLLRGTHTLMSRLNVVDLEKIIASDVDDVIKNKAREDRGHHLKHIESFGNISIDDSISLQKYFFAISYAFHVNAKPIYAYSPAENDSAIGDEEVTGMLASSRSHQYVFVLLIGTKENREAAKKQMGDKTPNGIPQRFVEFEENEAELYV